MRGDARRSLLWVGTGAVPAPLAREAASRGLEVIRVNEAGLVQLAPSARGIVVVFSDEIEDLFVARARRLSVVGLSHGLAVRLIARSASGRGTLQLLTERVSRLTDRRTRIVGEWSE